MSKQKTPENNRSAAGAAGGAGNGMDAQNGAAAKPAAPAGPKPKTKAKTKPAAKVIVTGPKSGRYRIGRKFGLKPVTIPLDELGKGELKALQSDPLLSVSQE